jgi:hypothetical protein
LREPYRELDFAGIGHRSVARLRRPAVGRKGNV